MTNCENCIGEGIVGAGEQPWLKQGALTTCQVCKGTGKLPDQENTPVAEPEAPENLG